MAKKKITSIAISPSGFQCTRCGLHKIKKNFVLPHGNINGRILFVGEAPGKDEDLVGKPFVGRAGQMLKDVISSVGILPDDFFVHMCCMCRPPNNRQPVKEEMEACNPYLEWVMESMPNLKLVVLLGATALYSAVKLKRIMEKRGCTIKKHDRVYLPVLHPAVAVRNPNYKPLLERDLRFAKEYVNDEISSGDYETADSEVKVNDLLNTLKDKDIIAVDIETSSQEKKGFSNFIRDDIIGMSFAWKEKHGVYLPFIADTKAIWDNPTKDSIVNRLREILCAEGKKLIFHNGKFDVNFLRKKFDINLYKEYTQDGKIGFNYYFDTMLAHHLIDENSMHGLKWLSREYSDLAFYENELKDYIKSNKIKDFSKIPLDIIYRYAAADADGTFRLYNKFTKSLETEGLAGYFRGLVMPLAVAYAETEYNGVKINSNDLKNLDVSLQASIIKNENNIYTEAGKKFNINSRQQLAEILFTKLKLPKPKKKTPAGGIPTDKATLSEIKHPIIEELLAYYKNKKAHSTYVVAVIDKLDKLDRVHTSYLIHGTTTGRSSSEGPNLQNIPAQDLYRGLYIADKDCSLVMSDYSQIELRVMAKFANDPILINLFKNGKDVHEGVAREILNIPPDQVVAKDKRRIAKTINFGLIYGMGTKALAAKAGIEELEAANFLSEYFRKFRAVAQFQGDIKQEARQNGFVKTVLGRKRRLVDINIADEFRRSEAERQAMNAPIQGTAAECTNMATIELYFEFKKLNIDAKLVLTVHDELVYEIPNKDVEQATEVIHRIMKKSAENILGIPVEIDQFVNNKWVEFPEDEPEKQKEYLKSIGLRENLTSEIKGGAVTNIAS